MSNKKCEGDCQNYEESRCTGEVKTVIVSGFGWKPSEFNYCKTAIEEDRRRGFEVVVKEDINLTTGVNGIEALRKAVMWLDSRPEYLNENKSPEELLSEWYGVSGNVQEESTSSVASEFKVGEN